MQHLQMIHIFCLYGLSDTLYSIYVLIESPITIQIKNAPKTYSFRVVRVVSFSSYVSEIANFNLPTSHRISVENSHSYYWTCLTCIWMIGLIHGPAITIRTRVDKQSPEYGVFLCLFSWISTIWAINGPDPVSMMWMEVRTSTWSRVRFML